MSRVTFSVGLPFEARMISLGDLVQRLWRYKVGGKQRGGFCKEVELARVGFVIYLATPSSFQ